MMASPKRLYHSQTDRILGGVSSGLAQYFNVDPTLVRVGWVLLACFTAGSAVLGYLLLWMITPVEGEAQPPRLGRLVILLGAALIAVGAMLALITLGIFGIPFLWGALFPLILVGAGILLIARGAG